MAIPNGTTLIGQTKQPGPPAYFRITVREGGPGARQIYFDYTPSVGWKRGAISITKPSLVAALDYYRTAGLDGWIAGEAALFAEIDAATAPEGGGW